MKKKIFIAIVIIIIVALAFIIGRQVGLNTEDGKTITTITEDEVTARNIQKTLTGSGQTSAKNTEQLELSTSNYFYALCAEEEDSVKQGENILEYTDGTYLTAPYDCVIKSINVPESEEICTSSNYIEVYDLTTLTTTISISENELSNVQTGQKVEIVLTADETKTYEGSITKIDSIGTYSSSGSTFGATVEFTNDGNAKIGMSLSCTIILEEVENVASISIDALHEDENGSEYVNKVLENGETEKVTVETGMADDSYVQIKSGLSIGDKVQIITETTQSSENSNSSSEKGMMGGFENGADMKGNMPDSQGGEMPGGTTPPDMPNGQNMEK